MNRLFNRSSKTEQIYKYGSLDDANPDEEFETREGMNTSVVEIDPYAQEKKPMAGGQKVRSNLHTSLLLGSSRSSDQGVRQDRQTTPKYDRLAVNALNLCNIYIKRFEKKTSPFLSVYDLT